MRIRHVDPKDRRAIGPVYADVPDSGGTPKYRATLVHPRGIRFDITDRLIAGDIGTIEESTEEDLLELTHGDVTLKLDNQDGAVERFFRNMDPADTFEVVIDRLRPERRRMKRDRLFGGVLDLPWSLTYDRMDKIAEVRAFSYSKLLERTSAEVVTRSFAELTGSVTAASKVVTITDTTGLVPDDVIRMRDNTNDESQTIAKVLTGTTVQTRNVWGATFVTGTALTVETPYKRDSSIQSLAADLFDASSITSRSIDIDNPLARFPVSTPMNTTSYPRDVDTGDIVDPRSFTQHGALIDVRMTDDGPTDRRAEASDPAGAWTVSTAGAQRTVNDWTAYLDVEPANLPDNGSFILDDGQEHAANHTANLLYDLREGGTKFDLYALVVGGAGIGGSTNLTTPFNTVTGNQCNRGIDVDPVSGDVWMSCTGKTGDAGDKDSVKVWNGAALTTIETAFSGHVRYLRRLKLMAIHEYDPGTANGHHPTTVMRLYDPATRVLVNTITVPQNLWVWTMRVWATEDGLRVAGLYTYIDTTRLRIWDANWNQIADYQVAEKASGVLGTHAFLAVFTEVNGGKEMLVGSAGNLLFVMDKSYRGVVPYADMAGMSVAAALREVALMSISYVNVDANKIGLIRQRSYLSSSFRRRLRDIGRPLRRRSRPLWEFYRTSVKVDGTSPDGTGISVISGDTGDSAKRLSLSGAWISTGGLAAAVGIAYADFLSETRGQEDVTVAESDQPLHVLQNVRMANRSYLAVSCSNDTKAREYDLRLVEV